MSFSETRHVLPDHVAHHARTLSSSSAHISEVVFKMFSRDDMSAQEQLSCIVDDVHFISRLTKSAPRDSQHLWLSLFKLSPTITFLLFLSVVKGTPAHITQPPWSTASRQIPTVHTASQFVKLSPPPPSYATGSSSIVFTRLSHWTMNQFNLVCVLFRPTFIYDPF